MASIKNLVLMVSLVATSVSAGYSMMPSYGSYPNSFAQPAAAGPSYTSTAGQDYSNSNYYMDNRNMHNSAGIYQQHSHMPMNAGMTDGTHGQADASLGYSKYSLMEHSRMSNAMPNNFNVRYTSSPSNMYQGNNQQYGRMDVVDYDRMMMPTSSAVVAYNNGAQMSHNGNRMSMSRGASPGYAGYAYSSMMQAPTVRPIMSDYHRAAEGHTMKMMNDGNYMHHMPSSYVSYSGNGANYRW